MKIIVSVYFLAILGINCVKSKRINSEYAKRFYMVDSLLDELKHESWNAEESLCLQATKEILEGVKNNTLWATWVWNSMQLPAGIFYGNVHHFGNFDQCLKVPWSSELGVKNQYCLVDVKMTDLNDYDGENVDKYDAAERYIGASFRLGMRFNSLSLGVCLPSVCKPDSVAKISRHFFKLSNLPIEKVTVDFRDCQVADKVAEKPIGYYLFWLILFAMTSFTVFVYNFGNYLSNSSNIIHCFCLKRNFEALFRVHKDEIMILHGIRVLKGNCLVVIAHAFYLVEFVALYNKMDAVKEQSGFYAKFLHVDLLVDTFFLMSGLLHMKKMMSSSTFQPFTTILQRYLRLLLPVYFLVIMCTTYILPHMGSGPAWPRLLRTVHEPCNSWWRNLLLYSNRAEDGAYHCSDVSWYIHTDFHLTILATFIFFIYRWNKNTGFIACFSMYILSVLVPTIWIYWKQLPAILLYDFGESPNFAINRVFASVYKPFFTRSSSYIVGIAMGYFMHVYKPQYYRNVISKTASILVSFIGLGCIILCLLIGEKLFHKELGALFTAFLASFDRTIWVFGVCCLIISCEYGTLPMINAFLSSKAFVPLSKLSFSNYLIHTLFIYRNAFSLRVPVTYDLFSMLITSFGYVVISYNVSFIVWMFIEAPVNNLITLIIDGRSRSKNIVSEGADSNSVIKALDKVL